MCVGVLEELPFQNRTPVIYPAIEDLNFTPTSNGCPSWSLGSVGLIVAGKILQGQVGIDPPIVTLMLLEDPDAPGTPMLPLSSKPRTLIVAGPGNVGVQLKVQLDVPLTNCQVVPPSTEISTPASTPPTSLALPLIVTALLLVSVAPFAGR